MADRIMVQQGIVPSDPAACALISAQGADPDVVLRQGQVHWRRPVEVTCPGQS
jgi:hypothetical protein